MPPTPNVPLTRRSLMLGAACAAAPLTALARSTRPGPAFSAGQGVVDTTPPLGIEMGGFHKPPGQERRVEGIRHKTAVRALALRVGDEVAAIVSVDILIVPTDLADRVARRAEAASGIPAKNIRICATHTHSMPSFAPLRQWGAIPLDYMAAVESAIVEAVTLAARDLAPAKLHLGTAKTVGASFNRTIANWKTDAEFTPESNDSERWLDTVIHALRIERSPARPDLLWYHFSAHPVCYTDAQAGPDWPGIVADRIEKSLGLSPVLLQGHAGDVNPGDGSPWIGDPEETSTAVIKGLTEAVSNARPVTVDSLRMRTSPVEIPIDLDRLKRDLDRYRNDPSQCTTGEWVDAGFAKDWFEAASRWTLDAKTLPARVSTLKLGELGWIFHPSELFSIYGLMIRHRAPTPHTLVVGYTDGIIGYLPDPAGFQAGIYEATVVPKILSVPPFTPTAARDFTTQAIDLAAKALG